MALCTVLWFNDAYLYTWEKKGYLLVSKPWPLITSCGHLVNKATLTAAATVMTKGKTGFSRQISDDLQVNKLSWTGWSLLRGRVLHCWLHFNYLSVGAEQHTGLFRRDVGLDLAKTRAVTGSALILGPRGCATVDANWYKPAVKGYLSVPNAYNGLLCRRR